MAKSVKKNYSKRVIFPLDEQQQFLLKALQNLNLSWALFAEKMGVHRRTLNDWKREEYSMPLDVVKKISKATKVKIPESIKIKDPFWYVYKGAKAGALAAHKKYGRIIGDPEYRKKKWYEWWEREGRFKKHLIIGITKPIKKPHFSKELAEFAGIVMGDGGITQSQVKITLHHKDDKEYSEFVVGLIKRLFDVYIGTCYRKKDSVIHYVVSRSELVRFCTEKLGLKQGNKIKQQVNIPDWIRQNKLYSIACVRGLIDTDGCIFNHRYISKGKWYNYKKLSFTSYSEPLRQSVFNILKNNDLNPRLVQKRDVRLDSIEDMRRYFKIFGSHNPKHLNKYFK